METTNSNETSERRESGRSNRGFASMNQDRQKEIARKGGRAAHAKGTAHEFTSDEARAAGQKGGQRVSANREHMSRIGRIGGKKSAGKRSVGRGGEGGDKSPENNGGSGGQPGRDADARDQQSQADGGNESGGQAQG